MKLDKKATVAMIESQYVNGTATLKELASTLGCSWPRLAQIGKEFVPGYSEAAEKRRNGTHKFMSLQDGGAADTLSVMGTFRSPKI